MAVDLMPHRGPLFKLIIPFTRYVVTNISMVFGWVFFRLFNHTVVIQRKPVPVHRNTLLLSNHQSMIDGFLVGGMVYWPRILVDPWIHPWAPAAEENFWSNPVLGFLSDNWKCLPIKRGRKDFGAMKRMIHALKTGSMVIFPEGTRTRDGRLMPPRSGIAFVMHQVRPTSVPVCMNGMDRVQPVGVKIPRAGKTVYLYYGAPTELEEYWEMPAGRETAEKIIARVFVDIRRQQKVLERYRRYRARLLTRMWWSPVRWLYEV